MSSLGDELLEEPDDRADLTALIDCVFLLLLFFIVTANFSEQASLDIDLPTAARAETSVIEEGAVVTITAEGEIALDREILPADHLLRRLQERHRERPIEALIIHGDADSPYRLAVAVMDGARALGIENVVFAVRQ